MKYSILTFFLFSLLNQTYTQDPFGLEELKSKSNDFTEFVMSEGQSLNEKIPSSLVPNRIDDFDLHGQDSLALVRIHGKFVTYYNYLLRYEEQKGISTNNLTSIFIDSANDSPNEMACFKDWYATEAFTIAVSLACYHSDIDAVKESCIARSIHATIVNNANVAECFKALEKK